MHQVLLVEQIHRAGDALQWNLHVARMEEGGRQRVGFLRSGVLPGKCGDRAGVLGVLCP